MVVQYPGDQLMVYQPLQLSTHLFPDFVPLSITQASLPGALLIQCLTCSETDRHLSGTALFDLAMALKRATAAQTYNNWRGDYFQPAVDLFTAIFSLGGRGICAIYLVFCNPLL